MKLIDKETGVMVANILTNHSMTIDEGLELVGCTVDDDGQIRDRDGELLEAWYDNIVTEADYKQFMEEKENE